MAKATKQPKEKGFTHLRDLHQDPKNARTHTPRGAGEVADSLRAVGAARSIVVDEEGRILAGNQTWEAAGEVGIEKVKTVEADGNELVAVVRRGLSEKQKVELGIRDNRGGEHAGWDAEVLKGLGEEFDLDLSELGFHERDLDELGLDLETGEAGEDPGPELDRAEELRKEWGVESGQLWTLGDHRLLCGDCTDPPTVERVMAGVKAVLMNTDPPYGVNYTKTKTGIPRSGFAHLREQRGDISADELNGEALQRFLESCIRAAVPHLEKGTAFYLWHPMLTQGTFFAAAAAAADILIHRQIIWVKPGFVLTRSGMYHWKHELCFYGWIRGNPPPWYGDKSQVTVWEVGREQAHGHPTQKPIELFARPMLNHTKSTEACYEPFCGSGSQVVAAEQLARRCHAIEIEPKYVAVTLQRWADLTGRTPELVK